MLYNFSIKIYGLLASLLSLFSSKAQKWHEGRKNLLEKINADLQNETAPLVWIHAASLGEFEQGRPLIEAIKQQIPEKKIVLTFFSPSGYEIRKNYDKADYIYYLPLDTAENARRFVDIVQPQIAVFIKYEFWKNYLSQLYAHTIPTYLISGVFRSDQVFFRWYGGWYKTILNYFSHLFVQNKESAELLQKHGIKNYTVAGDTRFDRVYAIAEQAPEIKEVDEFKNGKLLLVAGSTWPPDEELLLDYINDTERDIKFVIAPHEIHESNIERLVNNLKVNTIRYSQIKTEDLQKARVLIIDNIGMLSSVYGYADVAYVGGAFGLGLHNILEPATFGVPVVFGNKYEKFQEAIDLVKKQGAFSVTNYNELKDLLDKFFSQTEFRRQKGKVCSDYVAENRGGTEKIMQKLFG